MTVNQMHDLVIKNANIIDGSGQPAFVGHIAIDNKKITVVCKADDNIGEGRLEIDANGLLVTPGFVDIHTHYDGQATWDSLLTPSVYHGVSTVVMGNCGVGFAPVKPHQRDWLISLMEGVEDIPGTALSEGIDWQWESFPEFLDTLDSKKHCIDIAAQLPHGALRTYVMGERGGQHTEKPTADEIQQMATLAKEAVEAGALGFTTSRTINHKTSDGEHTPSLTATPEELWGIADGLKQAGKGVIQLVCDFDDHDAEFDLIEQMAERSQRPLSVTLNQIPTKPEEWRKSLQMITDANNKGIELKAQVAPRPVGVLLSLQSTYHPFIMCPAYQGLLGKPLAEQVATLNGDTELRNKICEEWPDHALFPMEQVFEFENPPNYEPPADQSLVARGEKQGVSAAELALSIMLSDSGAGMLYYPALNYAEGNSEVSREMLMHPHTVPGLGDGGAHVSFISDASFPTYLLTHWGRDRSRGELIALEELIKGQTQDTAKVVGLNDRGIIAPGMKADLNIIDFDKLQIRRPDMVNDLPAGGNRLVQRADGYRYLIVSGEIVMQDGEPSGNCPGVLIRGAQSA